MEQTELLVSDYLIASALHAAGFRYLGASLDGERVVFRFKDEGGAASSALSAHSDGKLRVRSFDMAASINFLKSELFGTRRAGGLR